MISLWTALYIKMAHLHQLIADFLKNTLRNEKLLVLVLILTDHTGTEKLFTLTEKF